MPNISKDPAWLYGFELATHGSLLMAMKAAVKLNLFEILANEGAESKMSAKQIAAHILDAKSQSADYVDRILRVLACHSILISSLDPVNEEEQKKPVRKYGISEKTKFFLKDADGFSLVPIFLLFESSEYFAAGNHICDTILHGEEPFTKAHGMNVFDYMRDNEHFNDLVNSAMATHSALVMKIFLREYDRFGQINCLVDVGGGIGSCLNMIVKKYPQIRGINFDQKHVIETAPSYPGVEHVAGDMFQSIPSGDAIFMKWILHDWNDEDCVRILRKCHKALSVNGKIIAVDAVLPASIDQSDVSARAGYNLDLFMFAAAPGGRERTEEEFKKLGEAAGFPKTQVVCTINDLSVVEFYMTCEG